MKNATEKMSILVKLANDNEIKKDLLSAIDFLLNNHTENLDIKFVLFDNDKLKVELSDNKIFNPFVSIPKDEMIKISEGITDLINAWLYGDMKSKLKAAPSHFFGGFFIY